MFITCQECNTTFRLDERLLKTIGSKVRCSQCRYTFVATPPSAGPTSMAEPKTPAYEAPAEAPVSAIHAEPEDQGLEGIDLAELDSIMEHETVASAPLTEMDIRSAVELPPDEEEELDEIDLDFDFDAALEAEDKDKPGQASMAADGEASDELSLDMDFEIHDDTLILRKEEIEDLESASLTLEEEPAKKPEKIAAKADFSESSLEEDLDMAFKDLELDDEESAVRQSEDPKGKDQGSDDLDLLDIDLDLESPSDERGGDETELSLADETEQGLDGAPSTEKIGLKKEASAEDDLSLMDLTELEEPIAEATAKGEPRPAPSSAEEFDFDLDLGEPLEEEPSSGKEAAVEDELSLDFESDFKTPPEKEESATIADKDALEDLEELSFEMDAADFDDKPAAKAEVAEEQTPQDEGDIDLSDIEQMLGDGAVVPENTQPSVETEKTKTLRIDDEIDLSEIESAIDKADEVVVSGPEMEEPELELDLGTGEAAVAENARQEVEGRDQAAAEPLDLDLDLELEIEGKTPTDKAKTGSFDQAEGELDLSDLSISDLGDEKPATSKADTVHSGDIELDFQIEEDESPAVSPRTTLGKTSTGYVAERPIEQTVETKPVEPQIAKRPKPVAPKKKSSKIGIVILLLMLLAAAAGGIYYAVMYMGMEIPYVSEYLKPAPKDPSGTANLTTMDINSKFIENGQSGRLFVITGKVRNGYGIRRNTIRLQGKLFTKGKVLVKTEFSYAGVQISDQELATLSIAEIKQVLNAAPASLDATGNVQPGQTLPFIVVFSDLPPAEQLDEFAVELVSSLPGQ